MTDDHLIRRVLDAVMAPPDAARHRALRDDLRGDAGLDAEYARLRALWSDLGTLPAHEPPEGARERARDATLRALAVSGERHRRRAPAWAIRVAAGVVIFLAGAGAGAGWRAVTGPGGSQGSDETPLPTPESPAPVTERPLFAFIVRGEPNPVTQTDEVAMSGFARELWTDERLVWAERLGPDQAAWLGGERPSEGGVPVATRLFMVRAADRAEAIRLARRSPHLARGGVIEILGSSATPGG